MNTAQKFDNQFVRFIANMEANVAMLENQRNHPVQQSLALMSLCSAYSEFLVALIPYYDSQLGSLRLRQPVHRRCKTDIARLDERLEAIDLSELEQLPKTMGLQSPYNGTPYYSEGLYSLTEIVRREAPTLCQAFHNIRHEVNSLVQKLADLPRYYDPQRLEETFEAALSAYKNSSEGQALMLTYRRNHLRRAKPTDVPLLVSDLDASYNRQPVADLYRKFAGNRLEFCVQLRKRNLTDEDYTLGFEYIVQREMIDELERAFADKPAAAEAMVNGVELSEHIFSRRQVYNENRASHLRQAIGSLFDDQADGIDPRQKNQMAVIYYTMLQLNLLRNTQVPAFMKQMAAWFPDRFDSEDLSRYCRSIYTELNHWRQEDGSLVTYDALFRFVESPSCSIRRTKADAFRRKIQRAHKTIIH